MGEYIGRLYNEAKRRPLYIVQEVAGGERRARRGSAMSPRRPRTATSPAAKASGRPGDARPRRRASSAALSGAGGSVRSASSLPRSFEASALGDREREQQAVEIAELVELAAASRRSARLQAALRIAALVVVDGVVRRPHPLMRGHGHHELAAGLQLAPRSRRARRGRRRYARSRRTRRSGRNGARERRRARAAARS